MLNQTEFTPEKNADRVAAPLVFTNHSEVSGGIDRFEGPEHKSATLLLAAAALRQAELQGEALMDPMTGLYNRDGLSMMFDLAVERAEQGNGPQPAILFIDLDNFKEANDTLGHDVGDYLLKGVAVGMKNQLKLREGEIIARIGGDEFVILAFPENDENGQRSVEISREDALEGMKSRLVNCVKEIGSEIGAHNVSASIGVADRKTDESLNVLLKSADADMYADKAAKHSADQSAVQVE